MLQNNSFGSVEDKLNVLRISCTGEVKEQFFGCVALLLKFLLDELGRVIEGAVTLGLVFGGYLDSRGSKLSTEPGESSPQRDRAYLRI